MTLVFHYGPTKIYQICKTFCRSEQTDSIYINIICHFELSFGKYCGFPVVHKNTHKNTTKVAIFTESRLGMTNNIYIQNQLVQIYKMLPIFGIFCNFLKIQF